MQNTDDLVRAVAADIATGDVMTYGGIGRITGLSPRLVGRIVARVAEDIPWWRVVRADGTLAACHDGSAATLLKDEGVPLAGGKVDWPAFDNPHRIAIDAAAGNTTSAKETLR